MIIFSLNTSRINHVRPIQTHAQTFAITEPRPKSNTGATGALGNIARLQHVTARRAHIVEAQQAQFHIAQIKLITQVGGIHFKLPRIALVIGNLANAKTAHRIRTTKPELLARHQRVIAILPSDSRTELPLLRKHTGITGGSAPNTVIGLSTGAGSLEIAVRAIVTARQQIACIAQIKSDFRCRHTECPAISKTDRMDRNIRNQAGSGANKRDVILKRAVVDPRRNSMLVFTDLRQMKVIAPAEYRAAATDIKQALQGARTHVRIATEQINRAVLCVERNTIAGTINRNLAGIFRRGDILEAANMIEIEEVRVLHRNASAESTSIVATTIISGKNKFIGLLVDNLDGGIDLTIRSPRLQKKGRLLALVFGQ